MFGDDLEERHFMSYSLRNPRGSYDAKRTAQLSGIPKPTLYEWRRSEAFIGDYPYAEPMAWSYRDLALLRLLAWLRQGKMERYHAADKIENVRSHLSQAQEIRWVHATHKEAVLEGSQEAQYRDDRGNILPFTNFFDLMRTFDLMEPIKELRRKGSSRVWAPDLVQPSQFSRIIPWVLAGEPCIQYSRVPTCVVFTLFYERKLDIGSITELYPSVSRESVKDSIVLESRLRRLKNVLDDAAV